MRSLCQGLTKRKVSITFACFYPAGSLEILSKKIHSQLLLTAYKSKRGHQFIQLCIFFFFIVIFYAGKRFISTITQFTMISWFYLLLFDIASICCDVNCYFYRNTLLDSHVKWFTQQLINFLQKQAKGRKRRTNSSIEFRVSFVAAAGSLSRLTKRISGFRVVVNHPRRAI